MLLEKIRSKLLPHKEKGVSKTFLHSVEKTPTVLKSEQTIFDVGMEKLSKTRKKLSKAFADGTPEAFRDAIVSSIIEIPEKPLSKRQRIRNKIREKRLSLAEKIQKPYVAVKAAVFINLVDRNIAGPIKPEYAEGFEDTFLELMKDPSVLPIGISNHDGHIDAAGTVIVSRDLTNLANKVRPPEKPFLGYMLTIASSLPGANQSIFLQQATRRANELFSRYYLSTEPLTRKKDQVKYDMDPNPDTYMSAVTEIVSGKEERKADGLFLYLPGTTDEAKLIKEGENKGQRKGFQKVDSSNLVRLIKIMQLRYHRKVVIVPSAYYGAFNVLDPANDNKPTPQAKKALLSLRVPKESLITVKVGMPIAYDELICQIEKEIGRKVTQDDIDNKIGIMIAEKLPPEGRGYYKDLVK